MTNKINHITTRYGHGFNYDTPEPSMIDIADIAHALSITNRFGGHSRFPYSVARHSVLCSQQAPDGYKLQALLHDATEAYISDIITPVKLMFPEYCELENRIYTQAIAQDSVCLIKSILLLKW
jgi:5'-deoxynucleotidase YfbR-like HD superfamily hydrolase